MIAAVAIAALTICTALFAYTTGHRDGWRAHRAAQHRADTLANLNRPYHGAPR